MTDASTQDASTQDALTTARELLGGVDDLPVDERPVVLDSVHAVLAAELAALDEV